MTHPFKLLVATFLVSAMFIVPSVVAQEEANFVVMFPVENLPVWSVDHSKKPRFDASVLISRIKNEIRPELWKSGRARIVESVEHKSLIFSAQQSIYSQLKSEISNLLETVYAFSEHDAKVRLEKNLELAGIGGEQVMLFCTHADSMFYEEFNRASNEDSKLSKFLSENYIVQCLPSEKAADLEDNGVVVAKEFGATFTILGAQGQPKASKEFDSWEEETLDAFTEFAERNAKKFPDARELLNEGLLEAKNDGKKVILQMGGPSCGPCIMLSRYFSTHKEILGKDFVHVKLDMRMSNAKEVKEAFGSKFETIPWLVILSPDGETLASGLSPKGNIGFPQVEFQQEHFKKMLTSTASNLTESDISKLMNALPKLHRLQDGD